MTAPTTTLTLNTAIGAHPVYDSIKDGSIKVDGVNFDFQEVRPLTKAFRQQCRTLDYDFCELAIAAYFVAREYGKPITALPAIVLAHGQHQNMTYNEATGVKTPKDLEGKRVGARGATVTPLIWAKGILKMEHGVDLDSITWVANDEEHVAEYTSNDPKNVERIMGANLVEMLEKGEIVANLGQYNGENPNIKPFYPDPDAGAKAFYQQYGVFPVDHLVVFKDEVLQENPWIAQAVYEALVASKDAALKKDPHAHIGGHGIMEGDPLPYGLEANRKSLQMLLDLCLEQQVLHKPTTLEELFPLGF